VDIHRLVLTPYLPFEITFGCDMDATICQKKEVLMGMSIAGGTDEPGKDHRAL
jgi:hypothetical protein